jgi:phage terminase large subunit GpA-like protein
MSSSPRSSIRLRTATSGQGEDHAEQQRRLDRARYKALLDEYRARSYADRRSTRGWAVLKRQIHRRDSCRCRLCGREDLPQQVDHSTYKNYAKEKLEDIIILCQACHEYFHGLPEAS